MKKEIPIYKLTISEDDSDKSEVNYVALVDEPAIERCWTAFSQHKQLFIGDKDQRIISGALMVADMPIYRRDEKYGEYYVVFDKETIQKIVQKFFRKGYNSNVNMMHDPSKKTEGIYMFESFIIDESRGILKPKGFDGISEGSWFGSFKVDNQVIWDEFIKTGIFKGFSVEGIFDYELESTEDQKTINELIRIINNE